MKSEIEKGTGPLREMGKLASSLFALGGATAAIALFRRVSDAVGDCISEYQEHEQAVAQLTAAFRSGSADISMTVDSLVGLAEQLQRTTLFSHDASESAIELMRSIGGLGENQIKTLLPLVQDLAVGAFKGQLEPAAMAVAKALGSDTNALARYGIELDKGMSASEKAAAIADQLREKFGGMAQAVGDTATGSFVKLKNAMADLKEEGGRAMANFFKPLVDWYRKIVEGATDALKAHNDLVEALKHREKGAETAKDTIVLYTNKIKELQAEIKNFQLAGGYGVWEKELKDIQAQIQAYGRAIDALKQKAAANKEAAAAAAADAADQADMLERLDEAYGKTSEGQLAALRTQITYWETASTKLKGHAAEIRAILLPLYEQLRKAMEGPTLPLGYRGLGLEAAGAGGRFGVGERMGAGSRVAEESWEAMGGAAYGQEISQMQEDLEAVSMASVGVAEQFANMANATTSSMAQMGDTTKSTTAQIVEAFKGMSMNVGGWTTMLMTNLVNVVGTGLEAVGMMLVNGADAWSIFRNAALNAIAAVLEAIGQELLIWGIKSMIPIFGMFNPVGGGLAIAGSVAAFIAAGAVRANIPGGGGGSTFNPVTYTPVDYGAGTEGAENLGSQTTIQRAPDIYIYITVNGPVVGTAGISEVGKFLADCLQEYAGIGGRIHIEEAIVPVRG
jgi:predicted  nucleic acid-binding Zn-ribbon protein